MQAFLTQMLKMKFLKLIIILGVALLAINCGSDDDATASNPSPKLKVQFLLSTTADRLDNFGDPIGIAPGNAAQSPEFEILGFHFAGVYQNKFTPYDQGETLFITPTTTLGGAEAIDFNEEFFITADNNSFEIPLSELSAGTYEYFRASVGYQKYKIVMNLEGTNTSPNWDDNVDVNPTLASFLGFNTYIDSYTIQDSLVQVQANKLQGYFGMEIQHNFSGFQYGDVITGETPQTTVPNPINSTSPVPAGSCVVTGQFPEALVIPANPTSDIEIEVVISINNSFEWVDSNGNGKWEPALGETVVDMGTRGVFPQVLP